MRHAVACRNDTCETAEVSQDSQTPGRSSLSSLHEERLFHGVHKVNVRSVQAAKIIYSTFPLTVHAGGRNHLNSFRLNSRFEFPIFATTYSTYIHVSRSTTAGEADKRRCRSGQVTMAEHLESLQSFSDASRNSQYPSAQRNKKLSCRQWRLQPSNTGSLAAFSVHHPFPHRNFLRVASLLHCSLTPNTDNVLWRQNSEPEIPRESPQ